MESQKTAALLLAAGKSSRSEVFKPLRYWGEETFLAKTFLSLKGTNALSEILVVTGHESGLLLPHLERLGARSVLNPEFEEGMQGSIHAGLRGLSSAWDRVLIALVDQPQLESVDHLRLLGNAPHARGLVRPEFRGEFGNPCLIHRKYLNEIYAEPLHDRGCAYLFSRHPEDVATVEMADDRCLIDFDREADLNRYRASRI